MRRIAFKESKFGLLEVGVRFYGKLHHRLLKITHWATDHHLRFQYSGETAEMFERRMQRSLERSWQMIPMDLHTTLRENDMMISNEIPDFNSEIDEKGT